MLLIFVLRAISRELVSGDVLELFIGVLVFIGVSACGHEDVLLRGVLVMAGGVVDWYGIASSFFRNGREGLAFLIRQVWNVGQKRELSRSSEGSMPFPCRIVVIVRLG